MPNSEVANVWRAAASKSPGTVRAGRKRGPANPVVQVLAGPRLAGGALTASAASGMLGLSAIRLPAAAVTVAQGAGGAGVAGGSRAADGNDVVEVFGDRVVGRPPGSGDRGDGGRATSTA